MTVQTCRVQENHCKAAEQSALETTMRTTWSRLLDSAGVTIFLVVILSTGLSPSFSSTALADDTDSTESETDSSGNSDSTSGKDGDNSPVPSPTGDETASPETASPETAAQDAPPTEAADQDASLGEPAEQATPEALAPPIPRVGYKKGFFIASKDERFKLTINGRIQVRFTYENTEGEPRGHAGQFSIPRARLKLKGSAFDRRIAFALQLDFGKGGASLKDAYIDLTAVDRWLMVQVGQFKRPFSRQQITSSGKQQFVDRAITDKYFQAGRDLGLVVHSHTKKAPLEYSLGLFNGTGDKAQLEGEVAVDPTSFEGDITSGKFSNVPEVLNPMAVARLGWHTKDFDGYSESDTSDSRFGIGVAASALLDFDADKTGDGAFRAQLDYALKCHGLAHTGAVYVATQQIDENFADQDLDAVGFHLQLGYVIKGVVEPVIRYARILPKGDNNDSQEILGGINVFMFKHNVKWTTDFGVLTDEAEGSDPIDFRARTQLQFAF
ncbi:MAG TPA: hypothetical protein DIU15_08455 [Deltaproteobacteria bacterium]|nr:hypothetical protein [Deltaproteobacteria bacterium]